MDFNGPLDGSLCCSLIFAIKSCCVSGEGGGAMGPERMGEVVMVRSGFYCSVFCARTCLNKHPRDL